MVVLGGGAVSYERGTPVARLSRERCCSQADAPMGKPVAPTEAGERGWSLSLSLSLALYIYISLSLYIYIYVYTYNICMYIYIYIYIYLCPWLRRRRASAAGLFPKPHTNDHIGGHFKSKQIHSVCCLRGADMTAHILRTLPFSVLSMSRWRSRCPANMAHIRQSRPDSGLGFLVRVPREQKMLKGHLPRVIYHQGY